MIRRSPHQSGFSLVELLVTALIFGVGLLGLAALQVSTLHNNTGGRNRVTASALAEGCLSAIQAEGSLSWTYAAGVGPVKTFPGVRVYTGNNADGLFGSFDVNGRPVADGDPTRVFQVNWVRLPRTVATPLAPITAMNMNEFVITVSWRDQAVDAQGVALDPTTLSLSRLIRYGVQP